MRKWSTHYDLSDSSARKILDQMLEITTEEIIIENEPGPVLNEAFMNQEKLGISAEQEESSCFSDNRRKQKGRFRGFIDSLTSLKKRIIGGNRNAVVNNEPLENGGRKERRRTWLSKSFRDWRHRRMQRNTHTQGEATVTKTNLTQSRTVWYIDSPLSGIKTDRSVPSKAATEVKPDPHLPESTRNCEGSRSKENSVEMKKDFPNTVGDRENVPTGTLCKQIAPPPRKYRGTNDYTYILITATLLFQQIMELPVARNSDPRKFLRRRHTSPLKLFFTSTPPTLPTIEEEEEEY